MRIEKKLTVKKICGDVQKVVRQFVDPADPEKMDGEIIPLARIVGATSGYETGETDMGTYLKFRGQFRGTNLQTGEEFRSGSCILPEQAADQIAAALDDNPDGGMLEFAWDISAACSASAVRGYEYSVEPLIQPKGDDPLERLASNLPALPSATSAEKPKGGKGGKDKAADA